MFSNVIGQLAWVYKLNWKHAKKFNKASKNPIYVNNILEGYQKTAGRFTFFWINNAGHRVSNCLCLKINTKQIHIFNFNFRYRPIIQLLPEFFSKP